MSSKRNEEKRGHHTYKESPTSPTPFREHRSSNGTFASTSNVLGTFTLPHNIVPILKSATVAYGRQASPFPKNDFTLCQKINFTRGNPTSCENCKENRIPEESYGTATSSEGAARRNSVDAYYAPYDTHCTCPPPPVRTCYTRSSSPPLTQESSSSIYQDSQREPLATLRSKQSRMV